MCGIAGVLLCPLAAGEVSAALLQPMQAALHHRGPDDSGKWLDQNAGIGLVHTRLSILDLSAEGHQPMASRSGRYLIVFNGEIYNFQSLRQQLDGPWRGHSDTEVLLQAVETWGLQRTVDACLGMFAFALWDRELRTLFLVRDRLGVKPLYVARTAHGVVFGSELKALRACALFNPVINRDALPLLLRYGYIPAPHTIYHHTWKIRPGTIVAIAARDARARDRWVHDVYWSAARAAADGIANPLDLSPAAAIDALESLLRDAVRLRMLADVPLGAFLSGGIDSSLVVALMQAQSERPVRTFSIGFEDSSYDEAPYAKAVAQKLGTDHEELYVTDTEARQVIPALPRMFDEPFADSSQIPTYLVSALARRHVTVALSGDGGDELFGGYRRYRLMRQIWQRTQWLPRPLRTPLGSGLRALPEATWDRILGTLSSVAPRLVPAWTRGHHLHSLANYLNLKGAWPIYRHLTSVLPDPDLHVHSGAEPPIYADLEAASYVWNDPVEFAMQCDMSAYLPDDILVKVDRASMAVGLEARNPFLDHRVVDFAWRTPFALKLKDDQGKWILRQVLHRHVPSALIDRPKRGFAVPIDQWLRGPLREWAEDLLSEGRLTADGFLDSEQVRRHWHGHLAGTRDAQYFLWSVLMFQAWLAENSTVAPRAAAVA